MYYGDVGVVKAGIIIILPRMRPATLLKATYFSYFASLSCLHPFLSLILSDRLGLSPRHVAAALLVKPLSGIAGGAVLCGLADQFRRHRAILCLSIVASGMLMQSLYWLRPGGVVPVLVVCSLIGAFSAPVSAIVDAWCTRYIEDTGGGETYERQRLWGAVGWGAFSAISTFLVDWAGSWGPAFGLHAVFTVGTAVVSDRLAASVGAFREEGGGGREEIAFVEKVQLLRHEEGFFPRLGVAPWGQRVPVRHLIDGHVRQRDGRLPFCLHDRPLARWGRRSTQCVFCRIRRAARGVLGRCICTVKRVERPFHRTRPRVDVRADVDIRDRQGTILREGDAPRSVRHERSDGRDVQPLLRRGRARRGTHVRHESAFDLFADACRVARRLGGAHMEGSQGGEPTAAEDQAEREGASG